MTQEKDFWAAIDANPEDVAFRLTYRDWLEEQERLEEAGFVLLLRPRIVLTPKGRPKVYNWFFIKEVRNFPVCHICCGHSIGVAMKMMPVVRVMLANRLL